MTERSLLWRRLDAPGHDAARLSHRDTHWHLAGTAVFAQEGQPYRLDYLVICDASWQTVSASVAGWAGVEVVRIELAADRARHWRLNGTEHPEVAGCVDVDLSFTSATNLLPIRRLGLAIGQGAVVRAAWLGFPGFNLEPLEQLYRRDGAATYHYESAGGAFVRELEVNETGFVTRYPGLWQAEAGA